MSPIFNPVRITFLVDPIPKGRPRKDPRTGHMYTPQKTRGFEAHIGWLWKSSGNAMLPDIPLHLTMGFFLKRPKRVPKTRQLPTIKPDIDNFAKAVLDALNGIAWSDDKLITDATIYKRYTNGSARIELVISPVILST